VICPFRQDWVAPAGIFPDAGRRPEEHPNQSCGITRQTSSFDYHTHTFTMTQSQLQAVKDGQSIKITDSMVSGHTHDYQIQKWF